MAAAPPKADGQEKLIAAAQYKVKSLATSKNAADDMIRIIGFDNGRSVMDMFPRPAAPDPPKPLDPDPSPPPKTPPSSAAPPAVASVSAPVIDESASSTALAAVDPAPYSPPAAYSSKTEVAGEDVAEGTISEPEELLEAYEKAVLCFESSNALIWDSANAATKFLTTVDELTVFAAESSPSLRHRAEAALQIAMACLEEEFRHLLLRQSATSVAAEDLHSYLRRLSLSDSSLSSIAAAVAAEDLDSPVSDDQPNPDDRGRLSFSADQISSYLVNTEVVNDLQAIAIRMIRAGYGPELGRVYSHARREALMDCLAALGVDRMSIEEVQKIEWGALDTKMKKWIQALKVIVKALLYNERFICDQIFAASDDLKDEFFAEAAKGCVLQLLIFGDAIAMRKRSVEKLFRMLGMYEALAELLPDLEALFSGDAKMLIKEEAEGVLEGLGDAVKGSITEFGSAIRGEASRRPLPGGEIHPLTRYVMNYVKLLADYSGSLNSLLDNGPHAGDSAAEGANMSPLGQCVLTLIGYLESNMEEKSKLYEDEGLQHIFLMNNLLYIVQKVKDQEVIGAEAKALDEKVSDLKTLLGDNWIRKRRGQIRQHSTSYLRASWTRILSFLKDDGLGGGGSSSSTLRGVLKDKFRNFNSAIEEIYRIQTAWKVPDPQLREELKISVSEKIIPAYRSFVGRFGSQLEGGWSSTRYIKYTPEDLENHISDLFEGLHGAQHNAWRRLNSI